MTRLTNARVVTPHGVLEHGWVEIAGDVIEAVGSGGDSVPGHDLGGQWLLPGFIDLHTHGGGGFDVSTSYDDAAAATAFHRVHGTTRTLLSLAAAPPTALLEQLGWLGRLTAEGQILGAHLEGPFLARSHCGAQNPDHLVPPDRGLLAELLATGAVRSMTLAPELPGAFDVIEDLVSAGVVVAIGHTSCSYEDAARAFAAGATLVTHLGNGMPAMSQREPGPMGAALDLGVASEVINDGHHIHPALIRLAGAAAVLVTDSMSAAGAPDGHYELAGQHVRVGGGIARLAENGSLAGSTLTMDAAVRRAVSSGLSMTWAARASSTAPAEVLGIRHRYGAIEVGGAADLVVLSDALEPTRVMIDGAWLS